MSSALCTVECFSKKKKETTTLKKKTWDNILKKKCTILFIQVLAFTFS